MSRRESRDTHLSKRPPLPRRPDRDPSPKRSRRDVKHVADRSSGNQNLEVQDHAERGHTHHKRLQDALPLEPATEVPDSKAQPADLLKDSADEKPNEVYGNNRSSDPVEVPRSRSYFQHDERGSAGQGGRSFARRPYDRERRSAMRETFTGKPRETTKFSDKISGDDKARERRSDNVWHHDGFHELESEAPRPAVRIRPAFREQKLPPATHDSGANAHLSDRLPDRSQFSSAKEEKSAGLHLHGLDELNRQYSEPEGRNARDDRGSGFHPTGSKRGRDRYSGRYNRVDRNQNRVGRLQVEKWKHDLFDEANGSSPKNDEDQIAKIEALLAL